MCAEKKDLEPDDKTGSVSPGQRAQIEDILRRVDAMPILDTRPEEEILGY
jgi:hypothetical protein